MRPHADPERVQITVTDGVVRLSGKLELRSTAKTLVLLVRELDGVVGVDDRLDYETDDLYLPYPIL